MAIIGQGSFLANYSSANPNPGNATNQAGNPVIIQIPSAADIVKVYNYTKAGQNGINTAYFNGTANAVVGVEFIWFRGMAAGTGIAKYKGNGVATISEDTLVSGGFTIYDPSGQSSGSQPLLSAAVNTTATSNAAQPVVSTGSTAGLSVGSVVRVMNRAAGANTSVYGIDMVVSAITANTNFTLLTSTNALANVPGAAGTTGVYRIVNVDPLFYPRRRFITNITRAVNAQVSVSVPHQYTVGQEVRFNIPAVSGMVELNPSSANKFEPATIVSIVDAYNFTIDIDTTSFTAFTFPTTAQQPSSYPEVTPFGENTAVALAASSNIVPVDLFGNQINGTQSGILADATVNTGFLGMILGSGGNGTALGTPIVGPAGSVHFSAADAIDAQDRIYWEAIKSDFGGL